MAMWLFKEEPTHYHFDDLVRDGTATWDGISNATALKHLRSVKVGDRVLFYHTGKEKSVVGEMKVIAAADGAVAVKAGKKWKTPVALSAIKADPFFEGWDLLRISRLSVVPVTAEQWKRLETMSRNAE